MKNRIRTALLIVLGCCFSFIEFSWAETTDIFIYRKSGDKVDRYAAGPLTPAPGVEGAKLYVLYYAKGTSVFMNPEAAIRIPISEIESFQYCRECQKSSSNINLRKLDGTVIAGTFGLPLCVVSPASKGACSMGQFRFAKSASDLAMIWTNEVEKFARLMPGPQYDEAMAELFDGVGSYSERLVKFVEDSKRSQEESAKLKQFQEDQQRALKKKEEEDQAKQAAEAQKFAAQVNEKIRIEHIAKTASLRAKIKAGDETHCGMVIEFKKPLVKVQTMVGERWFRLEQIYPSKGAPCRFFNSVYEDIGANYGF